MPKTAENAKKRGLTPLMRQYYAVKERHPGTILLFRMGDFYETFEDDAEKAQEVLGITLTKRSNGGASEVYLAGFPYHALDTYLPKLVQAGLRVAICEQLEEPQKGKKIVDRDVVEIVTPGVLVRDQLLDPKRSTYVAAVAIVEVGSGKNKRLACGISFADASTGEFQGLACELEELETRLRAINPAELLCTRSHRDTLESFGFAAGSITPLEDWVFGAEYGEGILKEHFGVHSLKGFGFDHVGADVIAAGALMHYLQETQKGRVPQIRRLERHDDSSVMPLDLPTLRNLELVANSHGTGAEGSLIQILDSTRTAMGARLLRGWLVRPLRTEEEIAERADVVDALVQSRSVRDSVRALLGEVFDLQRAAVRIGTGRATPRDLAGLRRSMAQLPDIQAVLAESNVAVLSTLSDRFLDLGEPLAILEGALADEPPAAMKEGGVIREGFSQELDQLRQLAHGGKQWLAELQETEALRTGITSLKVGFNKVFGYYLEVTNAHKDKVPEEWIRKQTLVNAERYITEELKSYEEEILGAQDRLLQVESALFAELREQIAQFLDAISYNATLIASLDVLSTFADVSVRRRYVRPLMHAGTDIEIEEGRHPVVEALLPPGEPFIPNSIRLSTDQEQILVITGPNMAGKSVVLRQVGLIVLLAQIGCFVPAKRARIGLVDRIFTRVGASDNLAAGESTFLVEMNETANILNNATERSLILLDEVGRGTSTFDGLSIAWALVEYLHGQGRVAARTLFATHYHELNVLEEQLERVRNYRIQVQEHNGKVIFLRKLVRGGADHSYGIEVARMAGLPSELLDRSRQILNQLEEHDLAIDSDSDRPRVPVSTSDGWASQMTLFAAEPDPVQQEILDAIRALDPNTTTPMDALLLLSRLNRLANES